MIRSVDKEHVVRDGNVMSFLFIELFCCKTLKVLLAYFISGNEE